VQDCMVLVLLYVYSAPRGAGAAVPLVLLEMQWTEG